MRYIWQHIRTILDAYDGRLPLKHFLKQYYQQYPKLGSRDRKILSEMAYDWYRCSKAFDSDLPFEDKLRSSLHLAGTDAPYIQSFLPGDTSPTTYDLGRIFLSDLLLSNGITKEEWLTSMLRQSDVFLRLRNKDIVIKLLQEYNVPFTIVNERCVGIPASSPVDKILPASSYAVQDASSQKTTTYFKSANNQAWWDCCSGAGGKSLALCDMNNTVKLTVSDRRESILHNLATRFNQYHLPLPTQHILDVSNKDAIARKLGNKVFDNIICDVPCTGSGTWARTPEQLYFFDGSKLAELQALQKTIAINASAYLKPGGKLFYITCSVFQYENEEVVQAIIDATSLQLQEQQLINGIEIKADSMFIAVLKKPE